MTSGAVISFETFDQPGQKNNFRLPDPSDPHFASTLASKLGGSVKHQICSIRANGYQTMIVRVAHRWWTVAQTGSSIELLGLDEVPVGQPVYEFLEPFWQTVLFLPWQSYLPEREQAVASAAASFDDFRSDGVFFSQLPAEIGVALGDRHNYPVTPGLYDQLAQSDWT